MASVDFINKYNIWNTSKVVILIFVKLFQI